MTLAPSDKALVPFVSVDNMMKLVHHIGIEPMLAGLADYIEADFRRWSLFDKTPRIASHSEEGVIELMPTSDGEVYGFKYVNGHLGDGGKASCTQGGRHHGNDRRGRSVGIPEPRDEGACRSEIGAAL